MLDKLPLYFWFEAAAFITSLLTVSKAPKAIKYFVPYLFFIVVFEYGSWADWFMRDGSNLWSINIVIVIEFLFYSYLFYTVAKTYQLKRFIIIGAIACIIATALNIILLQGFWKLNSYSYLLISIYFIIIVWMYFLYLLKQDPAESSLVIYNPYFWIAAGLMFFYIVGFVFYSFFEYMAYKQDYTHFDLSLAISSASIIILYSCLIIGFICYKQTLR